MNTDLFSDRQLNEAAEAALTAMLDSLPPPSTCQRTFSPEFQANMQKLCAKETRRQALLRLSRRAAMLALTCLVGASSFLAVNTDARATFVGWVKERYETFLSYRFSGEITPAAPPMLPEAEYRPLYLPEDYEETSWSETNGQITVEYVSESSQLLSFGYIPETETKKPSTDDWALDLTGAICTRVTVNDTPAELFTPSVPDGNTTLIWAAPIYDTAFCLSAPLSGDILIEMAESISITNRDELPPWPAGEAPVFEPLYTLTAVPDEYEYLDRFGNDLTCTTMYRNTSTGYIMSFQSFYTQSGIGLSLSMNADEYRYETLDVGGLFGEFYCSTAENAPSHLMWFDEEAGVAFQISGPLDRAQILCLAESVVRSR